MDEMRNLKFSGQAMAKLQEAEEFCLVTMTRDKEGDPVCDVFVTTHVFSPYAIDQLRRSYEADQNIDKE